MNNLVYLSEFEKEYAAYYDDHNNCFCLILTKLNYKPPRSEALAIGEDEIRKYLNSEIRKSYHQIRLLKETKCISYYYKFGKDLNNPDDYSEVSVCDSLKEYINELEEIKSLIFD